MEKWMVAAKKADFEAWAGEFSITPILARILRNRDLTDMAGIRKFLYGSLEDCYSPWLLPDMEQAVDRLEQAAAEGTFIRIIGDYDVDGICSSYILTKGLQALGAVTETAIPHRIHDGYGLSDHLIELAREDGAGMIVTCDNGIAAAPQVALARSYGIQVIVTDHHEVPFVMEGEKRRELLPDALAVIDPKRQGSRYPFPNICGAAVAYKVMQALAEKSGSHILQEKLEEFLEFAALATVCDVMELRDENRILVKEGLKRLKKTKNPGLRALMEVNGIDSEGICAYHLGFVLGPCLNATGRLDTAKRALELLQSEKKAEAMTAAAELKALNDSRKNLTLEGVEEAERRIAEQNLAKDDVMVIYLPEVHESLAGIIAGRIRERYHHPVFVLTKGEDGVKGSGRSIEGYHMYEAMTAVKHCFTKFGGHRMAAGLSMKEENLEAFRRELNQSSGLLPEDFIPKVHIDVPMPLVYADEKLAKELELLEPFGVGNAKPLFAQKGLVFLAGRKMGADKSCARFRVRTPEGMGVSLVYFGDLERFGVFLEEKYGPGAEEKLYRGQGSYEMSVAYQLGLHTYRGKKELQFVMQHYC